MFVVCGLTGLRRIFFQAAVAMFLGFSWFVTSVNAFAKGTRVVGAKKEIIAMSSASNSPHLHRCPFTNPEPPHPSNQSPHLKSEATNHAINVNFTYFG